MLLFCISCEKHPLGQMPDVQREQPDPAMRVRSEKSELEKIGIRANAGGSCSAGSSLGKGEHMAKHKYATLPPNMKGMPPGVPYIIGNEAAKRFSYYGMKSVLTVFMAHYILNQSGVLRP